MLDEHDQIDADTAPDQLDGSDGTSIGLMTGLRSGELGDLGGWEERLATTELSSWFARPCRPPNSLSARRVV